jgi:quinol monooxygenase YgiN
MIVVIGHLEVALQAAPALGRLAEEMQLATRAEPGCRHYVYGVDLAQREKLWISEVWASAADLERHFATAHMLAFRAAVHQLPGLVVKVHRFEAANKKILVAHPPTA